MEIREHAVGPVTVLEPVGKLVLDEGQVDHVLANRIVTLIDQGRRLFMVNLAYVGQVDTSGLSMLVSAHIRVIRRGGQIKFLNPTSRMHDVLRTTKLDTFLGVFTKDQDAIDSFT